MIFLPISQVFLTAANNDETCACADQTGSWSSALTTSVCDVTSCVSVFVIASGVTNFKQKWHYIYICVCVYCFLWRNDTSVRTSTS
jgi:hypothetical protein